MSDSSTRLAEAAEHRIDRKRTRDAVLFGLNAVLKDHSEITQDQIHAYANAYVPLEISKVGKIRNLTHLVDAFSFSSNYNFSGYAHKTKNSLLVNPAQYNNAKWCTDINRVISDHAVPHSPLHDYQNQAETMFNTFCYWTYMAAIQMYAHKKYVRIQSFAKKLVNEHNINKSTKQIPEPIRLEITNKVFEKFKEKRSQLRAYMQTFFLVNTVYHAVLHMTDIDNKPVVTLYEAHKIAQHMTRSVQTLQQMQEKLDRDEYTYASWTTYLQDHNLEYNKATFEESAFNNEKTGFRVCFEKFLTHATEQCEIDTKRMFRAFSNKVPKQTRTPHVQNSAKPEDEDPFVFSMNACNAATLYNRVRRDKLTSSPIIADMHRAIAKLSKTTYNPTCTLPTTAKIAYGLTKDFLPTSCTASDVEPFLNYIAEHADSYIADPLYSDVALYLKQVDKFVNNANDDCHFCKPKRWNLAPPLARQNIYDRIQNMYHEFAQMKHNTFYNTFELLNLSDDDNDTVVLHSAQLDACVEQILHDAEQLALDAKPASCSGDAAQPASCSGDAAQPCSAAEVNIGAPNPCNAQFVPKTYAQLCARQDRLEAEQLRMQTQSAAQKLAAHNNTISMQNVATQDDLDCHMQQQHEQMTQLMDSVETMLTEHSNLKHSKEQLLSDVKRLSNMNDQRTELVDQLSAQLEQTTQQLNNRIDKLGTHSNSTDVSHLQKQLVMLHNRCESYEAELNATEMQTMQRDSHIHALQNKCDNVYKVVDQLDKKLSSSMHTKDIQHQKMQLAMSDCRDAVHRGVDYIERKSNENMQEVLNSIVAVHKENRAHTDQQVKEHINGLGDCMDSMYNDLNRKLHQLNNSKTHSKENASVSKRLTKMQQLHDHASHQAANAEASVQQLR